MGRRRRRRAPPHFVALHTQQISKAAVAGDAENINKQAKAYRLQQRTRKKPAAPLRHPGLRKVPLALLAPRFGVMSLRFRDKDKERRERQRGERKARERDESERHQMESDVRTRLASGDLKAVCAERVERALLSEAVQQQIEERAAAQIAAAKQEERTRLEAERDAKVAAARHKEDMRLSEAARVHDILRENQQRVEDEARRRADMEARAALERQAELRSRGWQGG